MFLRNNFVCTSYSFESSSDGTSGYDSDSPSDSELKKKLQNRRIFHDFLVKTIKIGSISSIFSKFNKQFHRFRLLQNTRFDEVDHSSSLPPSDQNQNQQEDLQIGIALSDYESES